MGTLKDRVTAAAIGGARAAGRGAEAVARTTALSGKKVKTSIARAKERTVRIGITGLSRAGKTVFLTSVINHLEDGFARNLERFGTEGVTLVAKPSPPRIGRPVFPYRENLDAYRQSDMAKWPPPTTEISEYCIEITYRKTGRRRKKRLLLELMDYPGESLFDLHMAGVSYSAWSDAVVSEAQGGPRATLSKQWLHDCEGLSDTPDDSGETGCIESVVRSYVEYTQKCLDAGLSGVQPAKLALGSDHPAAIDFCPLPRGIREAATKAAKQFGKSYNRYVRGTVEPFRKELRKCDRQAVLVDVLGILRNGPEAYTQTRSVLERVLGALRYRSGWWSHGCRSVLFVATKADQCSKNGRGNLKALLEALVSNAGDKIAMELGGQNRPRYAYCAAHCATTDESKEWEGKPVACLAGVRMDGQEGGPWFPGEVPAEWALGEGWDPVKEKYHFRDFLPRPLAKLDPVVIPQLNLDTVLWELLGADLK